MGSAALRNNVPYSTTSTSLLSVGWVFTDASLITWFDSTVPLKDYTAEGIWSVNQNRNNSYTTLHFFFLSQSSKEKENDQNSIFGWSNNNNNYILYAPLYDALRSPTHWLIIANKLDPSNCKCEVYVKCTLLLLAVCFHSYCSTTCSFKSHFGVHADTQLCVLRRYFTVIGF